MLSGSAIREPEKEPAQHTEDGTQSHIVTLRYDRSGPVARYLRSGHTAKKATMSCPSNTSILDSSRSKIRIRVLGTPIIKRPAPYLASGSSPLGKKSKPNHPADMDDLKAATALTRQSKISHFLSERLDSTKAELREMEKKYKAKDTELAEKNRRLVEVEAENRRLHEEARRHNEAEDKSGRLQKENDVLRASLYQREKAHIKLLETHSKMKEGMEKVMSGLCDDITRRALSASDRKTVHYIETVPRRIQTRCEHMDTGALSANDRKDCTLHRKRPCHVHRDVGSRTLMRAAPRSVKLPP
ncbi:hypothetical protein PG991_012104 [Apiospora marii]|uniref:Uncharacterized protein n=1 Tax=Apiospora marii TaxID=335849 RepID=A0ABR1RG11_9PEZI